MVIFIIISQVLIGYQYLMYFNDNIGTGYINCRFFQTENDIYATLIKNSGIESTNDNINLFKNRYNASKFNAISILFIPIILSLFLISQIINSLINNLENQVKEF